MFARVTTVAFEGIEACPVDVQVQISPGVPAFAEICERARSALNAIWPRAAPKAHHRQSGTRLPIALGVMAATGAVAQEALSYRGETLRPTQAAT